MFDWVLKRLAYQASPKDKFTFFSILLLELVFFPFLVVLEELKKLNSYRNFSCTNRAKREPVTSGEVLVCIHEWAGYPPVRTKKIGNGIPEFECGLTCQLQRFMQYSGKNATSVTLTISDRTKYNYTLPKDLNYLDVSNDGQDFAGYAAFYRQIVEKDPANKYVVLTNTSVEKSMEPFLDGFIRIFEEDESLGFLGISYNTKMYQTLIRNNFSPHISSFFIMTTSDVLRQIVKMNGNKFPGDGITHKLLLIRKGEIKMSSIVLKLGYKLAFVLNDGKLYTFGKRNRFDNGYATWKLPRGDYRQTCDTPNKITSLNLEIV